MRAMVLLIAAVLATAACDMGRKSSVGLRLPDGDPTAGRTAFLDLRCNACHRVDGLDLPSPVAQPPVPVILGGEVSQPRTDGALITAIINPSHKLAPRYPVQEIAIGDRSRMGDYGYVMTVQQLIDIVAFLHDQYTYVPQEPPIM